MPRRSLGAQHAHLRGGNREDSCPQVHSQRRTYSLERSCMSRCCSSAGKDPKVPSCSSTRYSSTTRSGPSRCGSSNTKRTVSAHASHKSSTVPRESSRSRPGGGGGTIGG